MSAERARRRREARGEPVMAVRETGVKQPMNPMGNVPPKVPGEHRWIATALYSITAPQIEVMYDPSKEKHLDNENLVTVFFGCIDCERQLGDITAGTKCTAGDEWRD